MQVQDVVFFSSPRNPETGYLSNFYPCPITIGGVVYKTSEHFFQSQKFVNPKDKFEAINAKTPTQSAKIGRDRQRPIRKDWDTCRDTVMRFILTEKFKQHPELAKRLVETGEKTLVEHRKADKYWGDGGDGTGKNMLGVILMEIREELS